MLLYLDHWRLIVVDLGWLHDAIGDWLRLVDRSVEGADMLLLERGAGNSRSVEEVGMLLLEAGADRRLRAVVV